MSEPLIKVKSNGRGSFRLFEFFAEKSMAAIAFVSFAFIILILVFVMRESLPLVLGKALDDVGKVSLKSLWSLVWMPVSNHPQYGILPLIVGSLKVTLVAMLVAFPVAIFAALYTSTFANRWAKEIMKPTIEILAGFPSVVIGFFALTVLASFFQHVLGLQYRLNAFTFCSLSFALDCFTPHFWHVYLSLLIAAALSLLRNHNWRIACLTRLRGVVNNFLPTLPSYPVAKKLFFCP